MCLMSCVKNKGTDQPAHQPKATWKQSASVCFLAYATGISMNPTDARKCRLTWWVVRWLSCMTILIFDVLTSFLRQFPPNVSTSMCKRGAKPNISWSKKCSYFGVKLIKQHIFKPKCNCQNKSMKKKESVMVVRFESEFSIRTSRPLKMLIFYTEGEQTSTITGFEM